MKNHENDIIGVLQLINAADPVTGKIIPFSEDMQKLIESLASQAAVAITTVRLIEGLETLLESFIQLIADAIDEKSPYTGGHCNRVPELTMLMAEATCRTQTGPLANFTMDDKEKHELSVAGWLHDCGKIATPEYVMDKATKLQTIFDRIELVECRIELAKTQIERDIQQQIIERV